MTMNTTRHLYFILAILTLLQGCSVSEPKRITTGDPNLATRQIVHQYGPKVAAILAPSFGKVGVPYPPQKIAILTFKQGKYTELWAKGNHTSWHYIKRYSIAMSGNLGPKLKYKDDQIPEGIYRITHMNPFSVFHLSMGLNYPNAFDRQMARAEGRTNIGSAIFIHGGCSSVGCTSVSDKSIEELFVLVALTGKHNVEVITAPYDFRKRSPYIPKGNAATWTPLLYKNIERALSRYR